MRRKRIIFKTKGELSVAYYISQQRGAHLQKLLLGPFETASQAKALVSAVTPAPGTRAVVQSMTSQTGEFRRVGFWPAPALVEEDHVEHCPTYQALALVAA